MLAGCSGCLGRGDWPDVPTATITPVARPELHDAWTKAVANEAEAWNSALERLGCAPPFAVGDAGHPVRLIPDSDWGDADTDGETDGYEVRIREHRGAIPPIRALIVVHELGHAIGLDHADPKRGQSVMIGIGLNVWAERDSAAAACEMGCGPCEEDADPYDIR